MIILSMNGWTIVIICQIINVHNYYYYYYSEDWIYPYLFSRIYMEIYLYIWTIENNEHRDTYHHRAICLCQEYSVPFFSISRAGRAFLQALRVTRARLPAFFHFLFAFPVPTCFFKAFFSRTKIHVPVISRSKFCNALQFRMLTKKKSRAHTKFFCVPDK